MIDWSGNIDRDRACLVFRQGERMKHRYALLLSVFSVMVLLASCAQSQSAPLTQRRTPSSSPMPTPTATATTGPSSTIPGGQLYTDAKLGFHLTIPPDWQAHPQPGSQAAPGNANVQFTTGDEPSTRSVILLGIFHGPTMPAAFAARGTPTTHIGPYPAFLADRTIHEARAPCLVRIFLAGDDYVLADWCAPNVAPYQAQFEQVLATYLPAPATFVPQATTAPAPRTCSGMQQLLGYADASWGWQLATPGAAGWRQMQPGAYICSNAGSNDWYLFQCTELVNRFLSERWALPRLPGNAARYYDYYQDGVLHPGTIRTFPAGSYQLSDNASQGHSASRPVAGDILVFQDVNNPQVGWTSGLNTAPGHVAVIVAVDDANVYVAQENLSDMYFFMTFPIHKVANGYEITNVSGLQNSIIRGWIHFTVNGGSLPTSGPSDSLAVGAA